MIVPVKLIVPLLLLLTYDAHAMWGHHYANWGTPVGGGYYANPSGPTFGGYTPQQTWAGVPHAPPPATPAPPQPDPAQIERDRIQAERAAFRQKTSERMEAKFEMISKGFPSEGQELKQTISRWGHGSDDRDSVLDGTRRYANLTHRFVNAQEMSHELQQYSEIAIREGLNRLGSAARHVDTDGFSDRFEDATIYYGLAKGLLDTGLGLTPGVGLGKDIYETFSGRSLIDGEHLSNVDRSFAALGMVTGGSGSAWRVFGRAFKGFGNALHTRGLIDKSYMGIAKLTQAIYESPAGDMWTALKRDGRVMEGAAYKFFTGEARLMNPLPKDGLFARVMPREYAEKLVHGGGSLAKWNRHNEAFVTAYEDIKGIQSYRGLEKRLGLFADQAGTKLLNQINDDWVIVTFRVKDMKSLRSPVDSWEDVRKFGWLPGGRTSGDAREWLIHNDAFKNLVDPASIMMRSIK